MDEVRDDRWVQFVDFTGNEHRCNPEELKVYNRRLNLAEIPIYETYGSLHRFW